MSFRGVFIAIVVGTALLIASLVLNSYRPKMITQQPTAALVRASCKCAACHSNLQYSVVHEYELSRHAQQKINCLDCHQPAEGQEHQEHHSLVIARHLTAANCRSCHERIYQQFLRSRHAAPAWAAVYGEKDFKAEQVAFGEKFHPGAIKRPQNPLVDLEGAAATAGGCAACHSVGRPNADGSIGNCTACHTRHTSSVKIARLPATCGQCHMGPDHSQLEIYTESRHGVLFDAQRELLDLKVPPQALTTREMFVPTCATCHMSGLNGMNMTHDTTERLSYFLAAETSDRRPNYALAQANMKDLCVNCHSRPLVDRVYEQAEQVVQSTNDKVRQAKAIMDSLRADGLLGSKPFEQPIDFEYFDLWHYYGRTSKHGAFMGGADFVQWHGNYPLQKHLAGIQQAADELRKGHAEKP